MSISRVFLNVYTLLLTEKRYNLNQTSFRYIVREFLLSGNEELFNMKLWQMEPFYAPFIKQETFQELITARFTISMYDRDNIASLFILDGVIVLEVYDNG